MFQKELIYNVNYTKFLAKKIRFTKSKSFSSTVSKVGVASISIGIIVMIVSFATLFGFKNAIKTKLFSLSSHVQVCKITLNQSYEETPIDFNSDFYKNYREIPEIRHVQKIINKPGILKSDKEIAGIVLKGIAEDFDWATFKANMVEGDTLNLAKGVNEIIISRTLANLVNAKVNQEILIYFMQNPPRARKLKVVGIYETGLQEYDKNMVLVNYRLLQKMNGWEANQVGHYEVFLKDFDKLAETLPKINQKLPPNLKLVSVIELFPQIFDWFSLLDRNILIVLILIFIVASFNIVSVLFVMLLERTSMIGLLKTLGCEDKKIRQIFLYNAAWIIIRGIVLGNIFGFAICLIQYYFRVIPLDAESYYMSFVPIYFDWNSIILLNILTFVIVFSVVFLPTVVILRMKPVVAMKFKD